MPAKVDNKGGNLLLLDGKEGEGEGEGEVGSMRNGMGWDGMAILVSLFPSFRFVSWSFLSQKENLRFPSHMRTDGRTYSFLGYVKD